MSSARPSRLFLMLTLFLSLKVQIKRDTVGGEQQPEDRLDDGTLPDAVVVNIIVKGDDEVEGGKDNEKPGQQRVASYLPGTRRIGHPAAQQEKAHRRKTIKDPA